MRKNQHRNSLLTRRSLLQAAGAGAGATFLSGGLLPAWAQTDSAVETAIEWAKANLPASTPEIINAAAKEGKVVLTMQQLGGDETVRALIAKFNERYPFIDVEYTMQTSAQLVNKFNAEVSSGRGISDYLQLPSNLRTTNGYIEAGNIAEFKISQDDAYPETAKESGVWYAWQRQHGLTVYRVGALSDEEIELVQTYKGLSDPRFSGRIGLNAVTNSVSVSGAFVLQQDENRSLWDGLKANKPVVKPSSPALMDGLLAGEYDVALYCGYSTAANAAQNGAPIQFVISSPAAMTYVPGAISAMAPNPNAAKLWQDWAMSMEGQEIFSELAGTIAARNDIVANTWSEQQPWYFEDTATNQPIDWDEFEDRQNEVVATFKADMQGG